MLVSDSHRFIYFHIPKTGGTSVKEALSDISHQMVRPHNNVAKAREVLGNKTFDSYFKFATVRNPWDKMVSAYEYERQAHPESFQKGAELYGKESFEQYLRHMIAAHPGWQRQLRWIGEDGGLALDAVMRFERLQKDFDDVCVYLHIPARKLPHSRTTRRKYYPSYYNAETKKLLADHAAVDIEGFRYRFGG